MIFLAPMRNVLFPVLTIVTLIALSSRVSLATDYRSLELRELIEMSPIIVVLDFKPEGELLVGELKEVLKGEPPRKFKVQTTIRTYRSTPHALFEGEHPKEEVHRYASLGEGANIDLKELPASNRRVVFLRPQSDGTCWAFQPGCIQPAEQKERAVRILAMGRNPEPFLTAPENAGDPDLIYILGERFFSFRLTFQGAPKFKPFQDYHISLMELFPWQHVRFAIDFTYKANRKPQLQIAPIAAQGVLPQLFQKVGTFGDWRGIVPSENGPPPARFSAIIDTNGPEKVGDASQEAARTFLRAHLRSPKKEVVRETYTALIKMMDTGSAPAAIEMLRNQNVELQAEAARFLRYARDSRSLEPLCAALEALPPRLTDPLEYHPEGETDGIIVNALSALRDPKAVPALKRSLAGHPLAGIAEPLGTMGDESVFEPLLEQMATSSGEYNGSCLKNLVQRSNFPVEPWMSGSITSGAPEDRPRRQARWQQWWAAHKERFRVVRFDPLEG
jgi:hypothetical protein